MDQELQLPLATNCAPVMFKFAALAAIVSLVPLVTGQASEYAQCEYCKQATRLKMFLTIF